MVATCFANALKLFGISGDGQICDPLANGRKRPMEPHEALENSSADRLVVVRRKDRQKSRITNGSALLPGVDGRSPWVRRAKDIIREHLSDIPDASVAERSLVRRAAVLTTQLEQMERKFALAGGEASVAELDAYQRGANTLRRLLGAIGLERRAREIVSDPLDYAREHTSQ